MEGDGEKRRGEGGEIARACKGSGCGGRIKGGGGEGRGERGREGKGGLEEGC